MRRASALPFGRVRQQLRPFAPRSGHIIALLVVLTVLASAFEAAALVLVARAALAVAAQAGDVDLGDGRTLSPGAALLLALAALAVKLALGLTSARIGASLSARTVRRARIVLLESYFRVTWAQQSRERLGELQDYLTTSVGRLNGINQSFVSGLNALVSFAVIIVSAVAVNLLAAVGSALAACVLVLLLRPLTRLTRRYTKMQSDATRGLASAITESVRLTQEARTFGVRDRVMSRLRAAELHASRPLEKANFSSAAAPTIYQTVALAFLVIAVAAVGAAAEAEVASLGASVLLLLRGLAYGQQLQSAIQNLAGNLPFLDALHERLSLYRAQVEREGSRQVSRVGRIELRHVSFGYGPGTEVLADLDVEIRGQESIGVVGPSGSGKSTLLQLLLRLREPTTGNILVEGVDLWDVSSSSWAEATAFVPQDAQLLRGSVADNISFYRELDRPAIEHAARLAHIHDEIQALPAGYDTEIGDDGIGISGGQRQRLAIARALAGKPTLLLLDEPTSALDVLSERRLQQTLRGLHGTVTMVIVAHRLSTIQHCDRILVLRAGRCEGFDAHEQLLVGSAFYRQAVALSLMEPGDEVPRQV